MPCRNTFSFKSISDNSHCANASCVLKCGHSCGNLMCTSWGVHFFLRRFVHAPKPENLCDLSLSAQSSQQVFTATRACDAGRRPRTWTIPHSNTIIPYTQAAKPRQRLTRAHIDKPTSCCGALTRAFAVHVHIKSARRAVKNRLSANERHKLCSRRSRRWRQSRV